MPLLPPVTTATLPLSFAMFFSLVFGQSLTGIGFWTYRFRCDIFERDAIFLTVRSTITPKGGLWILRRPIVEKLAGRGASMRRSPWRRRCASFGRRVTKEQR